MTVITQQLRAAYHASGLTYADIAHISGLSTKTVYCALSGRAIRTDTLECLLTALKARIRIERGA